MNNCLCFVPEKDGEDQLDPSCKRRRIVPRVNEERNVLHTIKRRKANWFGHILHRNCLLKHVIEGKIEGTGRRGRRRKQLLDDIKETRR